MKYDQYIDLSDPRHEDHLESYPDGAGPEQITELLTEGKWLAESFTEATSGTRLGMDDPTFEQFMDTSYKADAIFCLLQAAQKAKNLQPEEAVQDVRRLIASAVYYLGMYFPMFENKEGLNPCNLPLDANL